MVKNIILQAYRSLKNDIHHDIDLAKLDQKITDNTQFSLSFLFLLLAAAIVCTLGLLSNSTAVVIGGMIISPIMWPLVKVSFGVTSQTSSYIKQAIYLLVFSIVISLAASVLITILSPIKSLNTEILARTNPNIMDIIIALAAGSIAALGLIKPKISDSIAGVAIATSLMPPICAAGIGLALGEMRVFFSAFYLFSENVVAIIFIAALIFIWLDRQLTFRTSIKHKAFVALTLIMVIISVPGLILLYQYAFKLTAYNQAQKVAQEIITSKLPGAEIKGIKLSLDDPRSVKVSLAITVPGDQYLTVIDQRSLDQALTTAIGRPVNVSIEAQRVLPLLNESNLALKRDTEIIRSFLDLKLKEIDSSLELDSVVTDSQATTSFSIKAIILGDKDVNFGVIQQKYLELLLSQQLQKEVHLDIEYIGRRLIVSTANTTDLNIRYEVHTYFQENLKYTTINSLKLQEYQSPTGQPTTNIEIELNSTSISLPRAKLLELKKKLEQNFGRKFVLNIKLSNVKVLRY